MSLYIPRKDFTTDAAQHRQNTDAIARYADSLPLLQGSGVPEGVVSAPVGWLYTDIEGTPGQVLYVKESGVGDTGWAAK